MINIIEKKVHSQNNEDGIIESIFDYVASQNRYIPRNAIEIGCNSREANCILLEKKGWNVLSLDSHPDSSNIVKANLTPDNILNILDQNDAPRFLGCVSIDTDYSTFHLTKRFYNFGMYASILWVVEYNGCLPFDANKCVPRDDEARWDGKTDYFGASLDVFVDLMKHHKLIYTNGVNSFFLDKSYCPKDMLEIDEASLWKPCPIKFDKSDKWN